MTKEIIDWTCVHKVKNITCSDCGNYIIKKAKAEERQKVLEEVIKKWTTLIDCKEQELWEMCVEFSSYLEQLKEADEE